MANDQRGATLVSEIVALINTHMNEWKKDNITDDGRASRVINVLINLCGSVLVSMSPEYHLVANTLYEGLFAWIENRRQIEAAERKARSAH